LCFPTHSPGKKANGWGTELVPIHSVKDLLLLVVVQQTEDIEALEAAAALQEVEFNGKGQPDDFSAKLLDQLHGGLHRASGGQQIIHQHNALAGLTYTIFVIGLGWCQIFTGLALYSESNPGGFWDHLVGWVLPLCGGSFRTHMWHHMFSWAFIVFAVLHVYVVLFDSHQYRNGLLSSIVSGYKFYEEGDLYHDSWLS